MHCYFLLNMQAGEALGAVAQPDTLEILQKFCLDERSEVAETCQIAVKRVQWAIEHGDGAAAEGHLKENPYESVDPAPANAVPKKKEEFLVVAAQLIDPALPLFERYRAMFTLRNNGSKAAVKALCAGLKDASPLFRHEVAYVLGQMANEVSADALMERVVDSGEHEMVRHEAAEALGAIGTPECVDFLSKYANDGTVILRESCQVALDIVDYWSNTKEGLEATTTSTS
jgi:deoxyhypusine monooxygenase